jgi:purine-binding chemotaxis protein CheW
MSPDETLSVEDVKDAKAREVLRRRAESLAQAEGEEASVETLGLLLFRLGEEWYAVPIEGVREIYNEYKVTRIPRVPGFILGVINVRGEIVSVTNLGEMMRVPSRTELDIEGLLPSAIIVSSEDCVTAIVVDEIGDIVDVPRESVEPPLSTLDKTQAEFVSGSVYVEGALIGIVNLQKVLEPIGESV